MELNKIYNESNLDTMKRMPDNSIDCVITSPPYWQLRDYGYEGQWGLEPTFQQYLEHLWQLMDEIYRVLKPTGTAWINLGDTYGTKSGNMTSGNMFDNKIKYTGGIENYAKPNDLHKCLLLIPHRFAIGCIDRGWIVRNDIIWAKRNGMPESTQDRFSKKHEYFFFMVKSQKYYFDLDAIRGKSKDPKDDLRRITQEYNRKYKGGESVNGMTNNNTDNEILDGLLKGKNPGSVSDFWDIPTKPSSEKHYASYNDSLLVKPVLAGCPEFVCNECGKPRNKVFEEHEEITRTKIAKRQNEIMDASPKSGGRTSTFNGGSQRDVIGLSDCGCNAGFQRGVIYDPFMGTGSTAEVAIRSKRNFIGSEMSTDYCNIAEKRIEPYLTQLTLL